MQVMQVTPVHTGPAVVAVPPAPRTRPARHPAAWLLDAVGFHAAFDAHATQLHEPHGAAALRRLATEVWERSDPAVRDFLDRQATDTPEEWEAAFETAHLGQWYRLLMAPHLSPTASPGDPVALRDGLPRLGWSPAEARRLARGRELRELAAAFGDRRSAAAIELVLDSSHRGWLAHDDVTAAMDRLRGLDRGCFRRNQDLVARCETLWHALDAAAAHPDRVLLLHPG